MNWYKIKKFNQNSDIHFFLKQTFKIPFYLRQLNWLLHLAYSCILWQYYPKFV